MALQWLSLVATIWLQSINGTNSNFPAYSSQLKKILSISQLQLNNLAFASDAGKLLGWLSGIAAVHLPLWLVLLIGSTLGLFGYGVQYLFLINQIPSLSYWHVFSLTVLSGNSVCWINTVCYILAIHNFPLDRQIAVGLSTSYIGLSAEIYTNMVDVIAPNSSAERAKAFLLLNSISPLVVCVMAVPFARGIINVGKSRALAGGFMTLFVITVFTGLFGVVASLVSSRVLPALAVVVVIVVFLLLPLVTPLAERVREKLQQKCMLRVYDEEGFANNNNNNINMIISSSPVAAAVDDDEKGGDVESCGGRELTDLDFVNVAGEEMGPMVMLRRVEFWLYFFVYLFGGTLGLVYLNNLGQIAESRGCSGTSSLVSLSSAFGFFGRLLPSLLHYFFSKKKRAAPTAATAMGAMMAPMCGAFFLLIISRHDFALYIATAIIGIGTGAISSIAVSTTTELFGTKNFGVNHNIVVLNIPIGSFLFGDFAALLYNKDRADHGQDNCMGYKCYQTTFMVWGSLCVLGTLLAFILHSRTKKLPTLN